MNGKFFCDENPMLRDYGPEPLIINIDRFAKMNPNYRTALWTGEHLQVTLMSIPTGGDIGLEIHNDLDQFIRIEYGTAKVMTGKCRNNLNYCKNVGCDYAVIIPAGTWHNIINIGNTPLKLYSVYAPPQHPFGTVRKTKRDAQKAEKD